MRHSLQTNNTRDIIQTAIKAEISKNTKSYYVSTEECNEHLEFPYIMGIPCSLAQNASLQNCQPRDMTKGITAA